MNHDYIGRRIIAAVGEARARELPTVPRSRQSLRFYGASARLTALQTGDRRIDTSGPLWRTSSAQSGHILESADASAV